MSTSVAIAGILILAGLFIFALLRASPEMIWQRRVRNARKRGQEIQRPADWERTTQQTKAILISCMIVVAGFYIWMLSR